MKRCPREPSITRLHRVVFACLIGVVAAKCGTAGQRPASIPQPEVNVGVLTAPFFGSGLSAPFNLAVAVKNRASEPVRITSIRIESHGMLQYAIGSQERILNETIAAGETKFFAIPATVYTPTPRVGVVEPFSLRTVIKFEVRGQRFREMYLFPNIQM